MEGKEITAFYGFPTKFNNQFKSAGIVRPIRHEIDIGQVRNAIHRLWFLVGDERYCQGTASLLCRPAGFPSGTGETQSIAVYVACEDNTALSNDDNEVWVISQICSEELHIGNRQQSLSL